MKPLNKASLGELRQLYRDIRTYKDLCTNQRTAASATRLLALNVNSKFENSDHSVVKLFFVELKRVRDAERELSLKSMNKSIAVSISHLIYSAEKLMEYVLTIGNEQKEKETEHAYFR